MSLGETGTEAFQYTALPARVLFGFGTLAKVVDELASLGRKRAFVLSDPHHAAAAAARLMRDLGEFGVELSTDAVMHTPVEVTERVMAKLAACNADCIVALGGGSTIGLADAVFGVKPSLIIRPSLIDGINTVEYGFGLADERVSTRAHVEDLRRQHR